MKKVVSIAGPVFHATKSLAKRLCISRSELFARALEANIKSQSHEKVREALDQVYAEESSDPDEALAQMQWSSIKKEEW